MKSAIVVATFAVVIVLCNAADDISSANNNITNDRRCVRRLVDSIARAHYEDRAWGEDVEARFARLDALYESCHSMATESLRYQCFATHAYLFGLEVARLTAEIAVRAITFPDQHQQVFADFDECRSSA